MLKILPLFLLFLASAVSADQLFKEKHLGIEFKYDKNISLDFNPHAMRKIPIYYESTYAGGFVVSVFPEGLTIEQFMEYGLNRYKSDYGDDSVIFSIKKNDQGHQYYHFIVKAKISSEIITIERAIFIKNRESLLEKDGIDITYTFNYKYSDNKQKESLGNLVNSFTLISNEPHYNDALSLSFNKKL